MWLDSLNGADTSIELHEYDEFKARFELLADDERGQARLF